METWFYFAAGLNQQTMKEKRDIVWRNLDEQSKATYGREYLDSINDNFESSFPRYPSDLTPVIRALRSGLLSKRPREKFTVGPGVGTLLSLYPLLPTRIADYVSTVFGFAEKEVKPIGLRH